MAQIVDMARGYPMMARRRLVMVKEAQNLKGLETLEKYLSNPSPTTVVVLCYKNGTIDASDSAAAEAGIKVGDVVVEIGGSKVTGVSSVQELVNNFHPGDRAEVKVIRGGEALSFEVVLK